MAPSVRATSGLRGWACPGSAVETGTVESSPASEGAAGSGTRGGGMDGMFQ